jgi:deoxyribodipyrimidine photo-lyase
VTEQSPILIWIRRDLRLSDHPALSAAQGRQVIPVIIRDPLMEALGAAPKWRLGQGIDHFCQRVQAQGGHVVLRSGDPAQVLLELARETGAGQVHWMRAYDPDSVERDTQVKSTLQEAGITARSFSGHILFEPWEVENKQGAFYRVYSPFWKAVRGRDVPVPLPVPDLRWPEAWPISEALRDWHMGRAMNRGAVVMAQHMRLGEEAAQARLDDFCDRRIAGYKADRDMVALDATSGLSENLTVGEISPAQCWHAGMAALQDGKAGAEHFLKELVWREFAYHLMWHSPHMLTENWRPEWSDFPWSQDQGDLWQRWSQGRTGIALVDAGLREMYVTGQMHNRVRMIVASYLTKHLMLHWRMGQAWFQDCLTDWDPASNAMGWQWVAGSGPDAAPYFRIFNPDTQADKFDPDGLYRKRWLAEGQRAPTPTALSYFDAVPRSWGLSPDHLYPNPIVSLADGRQRALAAYETLKRE